ncbi:hypothetical protein BHM03_00058982 [Ensete ventricosum]|nr:hypothetical protein BHM03_00058982 [Ensete ventricosum]
MMASSRSAAMRVTMLMKKRMVTTERQRLQEGQRRWQKYQICRRKQAADEWTMMEDNKSLIAEEGVWTSCDTCICHQECSSSTHRLLGRERVRSGKEEDPSLRVGEKGQR